MTLAYSTGAYLDTISQGIENLRTGSSLATANLAVVHPGTWGAIVRQKDGNSRYLLNPDPSHEEANQVWGRYLADHGGNRRHNAAVGH